MPIDGMHTTSFGISVRITDPGVVFTRGNESAVELLDSQHDSSAPHFLIYWPPVYLPANGSSGPFPDSPFQASSRILCQLATPSREKAQKLAFSCRSSSRNHEQIFPLILATIRYRIH